MTSYSQDWVQYFTETWDIFKWLSDYGTVYSHPHFDTEHHYTYQAQPNDSTESQLRPEILPDMLVTFEKHDDTIACFVVDGESFTQLIKETTANGRTTRFFKHAPSFRIDTENTETDIDAVVLVNQFSPFGKFFTDSIPVTNAHSNDQNNVSDDNDFSLFLYGGIFVQTLTTNRMTYRENTEINHPSLDTLQHGILTGSSLGEGLFETPTALLSPKPTQHSFDHPHWERYNKWH